MTYAELLQRRQVQGEPPVCQRPGCTRHGQPMTPTCGAGCWRCLGADRRVSKDLDPAGCTSSVRLPGSHPGFEWGLLGQVIVPGPQLAGARRGRPLP